MDVISSKKITEATEVFGRNVSQGSSFKNYGQFNSNFSIAIWCWGCAESPTFLFHSLTLSYGIRWYYLTTQPLFLKPLFPLFDLYFFWGGICKSRLYSLDVSTDIPISDSLLVYVYQMMIAFHENPETL